MTDITNTNPPGTMEAPSSPSPADAGGAVEVAVPPAGEVRLSLAQRDLARHALGLPNKARKSYRNHFVCGPGHDDFDNWVAMVAEGAAKRRAGSALTGGDDLFRLTRGGAEAALNKGERLDAEDSPLGAGLLLNKEGK